MHAIGGRERPCMPAPTIFPFYVEREGRLLFMTLYSPRQADHPPEAGFVFCPAFGEEGEVSRRVFHELACQLAVRGLAVLVPDLAGTANSSGDLSDMTLADWSADIELAARELASRIGVQRVGLLGLRFGCVLALLAIDRILGITSLVLLGAPLRPERHFLSIFRRAIVRDVVSRGKSTSTRSERLREGQRTGVVDFDGYPISVDLIEELGRLTWQSLPTSSMPLRVGIANLRAFDGGPTIVDRLRRQLPAATYEIFFQEDVAPLWSRLGMDVPEALLIATTEWMTGGGCP